jgi:hypothetical protein
MGADVRSTCHRADCSGVGKEVKYDGFDDIPAISWK